MIAFATLYNYSENLEKGKKNDAWFRNQEGHHRKRSILERLLNN